MTSSGWEQGREGDWKCEGCGNRNYAFRSFCNRCRQPRLLMDSKTPPDSKWLPRIGDWICTGCSNNNYASREKCKKCGEPKEVAAMPAMALPGISFHTPGHYLPRPSGGLGLGMNMGMPMPLPHQTVPSGSGWPFNGTDTNALPGSYVPNLCLLNPRSWRAGDWMCMCGYHNYSSRAMCKQCNALLSSATSISMCTSAVSASFPGLGTKRLASAEFGNDWMNKRLHVGGDLNSPYLTQQPLQFGGLEGRGLLMDQSPGLNMEVPSGGLAVQSFHIQASLQPPLATVPTLLGKGAKQWRSGDWMCVKCSNHNFASREQCNRCNARKEVSTQPVPVI